MSIRYSTDLDYRSINFRPMKPFVITPPHKEELVYPLVTQPRPTKSIRVITIPNLPPHASSASPSLPVTNYLRPLENDFVRGLLSKLPQGLDGYVASIHQEMDPRSMFMNKTFFPGNAGSDWFFYVVDYIYTFDNSVEKAKKHLKASFQKRYTALTLLQETLPVWVKVMPIQPVSNLRELDKVAEDVSVFKNNRLRLYTGHGFYRYGQTTWKEYWCMEMAL